MGCPIPMIAAKQSWIGRTASLPQTTVFTPSEDGDYRVNLYVVSVDNSSQAIPTLYFTDEFRSYSVSIPQTGGDGFSQTVTVFHAKAGEPIQLSIDLVSGGYDAFITVVQE